MMALNVLYFHGETGRYLEHARGVASLNLQKICRPGLLVELSPAIQEAKKSERPVRREHVRVEFSGEEHEISFEVIPVKLPGIESRYFLILFGQPSAATIRIAAARAFWCDCTLRYSARLSAGNRKGQSDRELAARTRSHSGLPAGDRRRT